MATAKDSAIANELPSFSLLETVQPLRERVYEALEGLIVDGALASGQHLREDDLATRLGVSRNPVREALQWLVHDGFADHQPGKGTFVHAPTMQEVEEVFHTRAVLESETAYMAAARITMADLTLLENILEQGHAAVKTQGVGELLKLNEAFHNVIIGAANNAVMAKMMLTLRRRIRWYFSSVVATRAVGSWDQHRQIYEALRVRDGSTAAQCMAVHVRQTGQAIQNKQNPKDD